jgi:branched-chain amino acid transport system substrate-binding protein
VIVWAVLPLLLLPAPASAQAQKVRLGAVCGLTGPFVSVGLHCGNAIRQATTEINEAGGLNIAGEKRLVDLILLDDAGNPSQAVAQVLRLITKEHVKLVVGPPVTKVALPTVQVTQKNSVIHLSSITAIERVLGTPGHEFLFKTIDNEYGPHGRARRYAKVVGEIAKQNGVRKLGLLFANDDFAKDAVKVYEKELVANGLEIVALEWYEFKATDLYPALNKIKAAGPDALLWYGHDSNGQLILKQALEVGLTKKFFATITPSLAPGLDFKDRLELYVVPNITRSLNMADPRVVKWAANYRRIIGIDPPTGVTSGFWFYDQVKVLLRAVEKAGTADDVAKIRDALRGFKYTEGLMDIYVDPEKQVFRHDFSVELLKNGAVSYLTVPLE